ncbi:glycosyltransferase family 2 protein [Polynucleobacter paneuropaeus]|nr:glycosyltransferase family 2 protein [Polynucleobacter paneuropaeus]
MTISSAIDSLYRQTYQNIEIIVVNDASPETDAIERVLEHYSSIVYIKNIVNLGLAASRNVGLRKSRGEFVAFLDADDEYHPQKIELQMRFSGENLAVACDVESFDKDRPILDNFNEPKTEYIEIIDSLWKISLFNYLTGASILARRDLLLRIGGYDESLRSCEDYDLWIRLLKSGVKVVRIKLALYWYRFNPGGLSKNIDAISYWELMVVRNNFLSKAADWTDHFFIFIILTTWFIRHLLRAEFSNNSQLKNTTLINAKNFKSSPFSYYLILGVAFLKIPWLLVTIDNFFNGAASNRLTRHNSNRSKKIHFDSSELKKTIFLSNKIIWGFFLFTLLQPHCCFKCCCQYCSPLFMLAVAFYHKILYIFINQQLLLQKKLGKMVGELGGSGQPNTPREMWQSWAQFMLFLAITQFFYFR